MKQSLRQSLILSFCFGLIQFSLYAQMTQQERASLLEFARERNALYMSQRAEAESLAKIKGIPIRRVTPDGTVMELQRFEGDLPLVYATDNLNAAKTISTNKVWSGGGFGYSLSGVGQTLHFWDGGGVRLTHQELSGRVFQIDSPSELNFHATHVAGTMIATGVNSNAQGMSNQATLRAFDFNNDESEMASEAASGSRISNHSYGLITGWRFNYFGDGLWTWFGNTAVSATIDYYFGFYSTQARDWDDIAFDAPYYLIVKSSGNDRGEGPSGTVTHRHSDGGTFTDIHQRDGGSTGYDCISHAGVSKNILTIGAVNDIPGGYTGTGSVSASSFHSWGPADDGRIKPDVVGNGVDLISSLETADNAYGSLSGTSMSSPNVAGSIGLILEHEKNLWGTNSWRASTIKGLVIHTADEAGAADGPDYIFGWGLMNTLKAVQLMSEDSVAGGNENVREYTLTQSDTIEFNIESDGTQPLRLTICWTDPPGTPPPASLNPTTKMLVNDLDIRLIRRTTTYMPYVLDPNSPATDATTGDNSRDNVEQIYLATPAKGLYTVQITHKGTLNGGSQKVSFIMSGGKTASHNIVQGFVYEDNDGIFSTTTDRTGSAGWKVKVFQEETQLDSQFTVLNGKFYFDYIDSGYCDIVITPRNSFTNLDVVPGMGGNSEEKVDSTRIRVHFSSLQNSTENTFLIGENTKISGKVFEDVNGNRAYNSGEPLHAQRVITLSGTVNAMDTSDINGNYEFNNLPPGIYTVSETLEVGWTTSTPAAGVFTDTLESGTPLVVNFGNFRIGTASGVKFRDSNRNGQKDVGEPLLQGWKIVAEGITTPPETVETGFDGSYEFSNLGADTYTISEMLLDDGWAQTKPDGNYTIAMRSGLDTTGLDFGNFPLDSIKYRTASMSEWALATDAKGKYKLVKRKPDKVEFKFNLIPETIPTLNLSFSMNVAGTITKGKTKADTLATFSGKKISSLLLNVVEGDTIQVDGWGVKGKPVKVKYAWGNAKKFEVTDFKTNMPRLPLPNLHNVGEELYVLPGGLGNGLKVGIGDGAGSVSHAKYKDVQKSLRKRGAVHSGDAKCLTGQKKQLKSLSPDKGNNKLFAELLALKLNVIASELESFPIGLGDIIYADTGSAFYGKTVKEIMLQTDTFLTKCDTVNPKGVSASEYYNVLVAIDTAFSGEIDTVSFGTRAKLTGVRYLADVPYLKPNPEVTIGTTTPEFVIQETIPEEYTLYQNYPNPFNPITTIRFSLPEEARVTLKVYNLLGQEVATVLEHEEFDEGAQEVEFDAQGLSSGVYFYRLTVESLNEDTPIRKFSRVMKMLMLK
jgi:hypothetical protein